MAIQCPYCQHGISVKGLKPGRFSPKCPKCAKPFRLTVADDPANTMTVEALAGAVDRTAPPAAVQQGTIAPEGATLATGATGASTPGGDTATPPVGATVAAPSRAPATVDATLAKPPSRPPAGVEATVARPPSRPPSAADATAPSGAGRAASGTGRGVAVAVAPDDEGDVLTGTLGGYELVKRLGQGGMGAVYLARQLSLDRSVAVKTMNPEWAHDANFVARFTREAYAAAQLNHHNVVQIYDIGAENDTNYFSMEFVDGKSLGDLMKEKGRLDPEEAVGYILQAARGLKFAHDQGMVHRDIKPDNLMINRHGIVKVADLGLVKTPASVAAEEEAARAPGDAAAGTPGPAAGVPGPGGPGPGPGAPAGKSTGSGLLAKSAASSATRVDVAMGTPAYMPPEQARNAAGVDQRADIYSLGCTLYVLVTGRPVHEGATAIEVMSKHATEPITPPDVIVERVPKTLSAIVQKMTAKLPGDRYQSMDEVIKVLEEFLGISSAGPFTPREEHARVLEESVKAFNGSKPARLRRQVIWGFYGFCALLAVVLGLCKQFWWAGGIVGLGVLTTLCYQIVVGVTQKTFLFAKAREWAFGAGWKDWAKTAGAVVVAGFLLWVFGMLGVWLLFLVIAAGLAIGFTVVIDRMVAKDRKPALDNAEEMLKTMRLRGLEEQALRMFICKYSGIRWEEFYEALFDYEAKLKAREMWGKGDSGKARKKHAAWRETIISTLEARIQQRKELREKKHLQKIEEKKLKAAGMSEAEAHRKAGESAETMVAKAAELKDRADQATMGTLPPGRMPTFTAGSLLATDDDAARIRERQRKRANSVSNARMNMLFGRVPRFVVGALLVAVCYLWLQRNGVFGSGGEFRQAVKGGHVSALSVLVNPQAGFASWKPPLVTLPAWLGNKLFNSINIGVAGLILVLSAFLGRLRLAFIVIPAAAIAWLGPLAPIPTVGGMNPLVLAMLAGGALALLGFVFVRK